MLRCSTLPLHLLKTLLLASFFLTPPPARAEFASLPTLETSTIDAVFNTFAASTAFKSLEPASDLGTTFGLYLGAGVNLTDSSALAAIGANTQSAYLPGGEFQLGVGFPKGFTFELGIVPTLTYQGNTFSKYAGGLKWTLNRTLLKKFPLSVAVRVLYGNATIGYSQTDGSGTLAVDYSSSTFGASLSTSKYLGAAGFGIEPYAGIGLLVQSSTLAATGTGTLFGSSFPAATSSYDGSGANIWLQAGVMLKLGVLSAHAGIDYLFGNTTYAGKVVFRF